MKLIFACLLLLSPALPAADNFEGTVTFKVSGLKGDSHTLDYSMKGDKTRVDMATPKHGTISVIADNVAKTSLMLLAEKKVAIQSKLVEPSAKATANAKVTKTGKSAEIAGYHCDEFSAAVEGGTAHIWAAQGLGRFRHFQGGPMGRGQRVPGWEKEFLDKGYFPLKMEDKGTVMVATHVEKKSLPDSLFELPPGYALKTQPERIK